MYIIHLEEVFADNFALIQTNRPQKSPEIVARLKEILKENSQKEGK